MSDPLSTIVRVVPVIELRDSYVSEPIEGASGHVYSRISKRHPDTARRSYCFPHPALETEETIQRWLADWPRARYDIFEASRALKPAGVEFVVQVRDGDKWVTVEARKGLEFEVLNAVSTSGRSAGSCPAHIGSNPITATSSAPRKRGRPPTKKAA
jgi:hypothetical protein